jgi:hypothetical protein
MNQDNIKTFGDHIFFSSIKPKSILMKDDERGGKRKTNTEHQNVYPK